MSSRAERGIAAKLEVRNLGKTYRKRDLAIEALRDLSFAIADGEFVSIVGASGCGKTTLLRMIDGLIAPTSGNILLDERPLTGPGSGRAFVFQQDRLLPWRTVEANEVFGPELRHENMREARRRAPDAGKIDQLVEGLAERGCRIISRSFGSERHMPAQEGEGIRLEKSRYPRRQRIPIR